MKINDYTFKEKQNALDEAFEVMNPMPETTAERLKNHLETNAKEYYEPIVAKTKARQALEGVSNDQTHKT